MEARTIIVTVVGDGTVGKTCLINKFIGKEFDIPYIPTVLEEFHKTFGKHDLHIKDTAGVDEFARLRVSAYPGTDIFVVCFSLSDLQSYKDVKYHWRKELGHCNPGTPFVLVGTKLDLEDSRTVSYEDGVKLQKDINASFYVECSAKDGRNINNIFENAVNAHLAPKKRKRQLFCPIIWFR